LDRFIYKSPGTLYYTPAIHSYQPFSYLFIQAKSMTFFVNARKRDPNLTIRVHPLLLSLTETIDASETNPDMKAISENDERALRSAFYTPPNTLPPLEIHFSGQNGLSLLQSKQLFSHICSWLPRMHGIYLSGQLRRQKQFGRNIPCPGAR
jgi:hypothetical protein